jgi:predicted enzyme related to lactoylglutathione lyase
MIMSKNKLPIGSITWTDLTVHNTEQVRAFYPRVVGWKASEVPMGEYSDYNMDSPDNNQTKAVVCHARAVNA